MDIPLLPDIVAIFCLSIGVLLVCHQIKIPPIVGFLLTGVLCGPTALGLVQNPHAVELLAEIGVVLLLFSIGLEMSGEELMRLKRPVFVGGTAQVVLTIGAFMGLGVLIGQTWQESMMYGFLASLSSTAIVLSRLQQKAQSESPQGRLDFSVLIFQDIAVVPMMLAIPILAGEGDTDIWGMLISAGRTLVILVGGWLLARHVVPRVMQLVLRTRSKELMLMTVLGLCFAIALGTASLGLSLALGAFLAGLLLSGSEYSLNVLEGILPFKDVFTSLFFISVGMLLDVDFLVHHLDKVFLFAALLILLKSVLSLPPMLLVGYPLRVSILAAMSLAQIGEFSFVLASSAVNGGLMDDDAYQMFLAASIVTMILTPTVMEAAPKVASFVSRYLHLPIDEEAAAQKDESLKDHLIIVGFGVGGKHLARTAREAGIPYVILEMNPDTVSRYGGKEPIHGGDASKPLVLEHFGIRNARVIAVVISDPSAVRAITAVARKLNPKVHIVVRTRFLGEVDALRRLGANDVIPEDFETSIEVFSRVLGYYLVPRQTIERFVNSIRHEYYNMARQLRMTGMDLPSLADEVLTGLEVVACKVEPGCALDGKRLTDTSLRRKYGVTVVGIRHAGQIIPSPGGDASLHGDDTVFLFASPASLTTVMPFFHADPEPEKAEDL
ncbi:cation:proton antiporter [uncultured Bilophila sp.]|uniref:cation:proton antiporter domain-containing protein n=1 Tax=uncultured Bilophila sp. TaxID=529385 RepID=UPI00266FC49E|nr:cation:proton antiporter [uncultured Bilophila sp.]